MEDNFDGVLGVYLLHFDPLYLHAKHYLRWSSDIGKRFREHTDPNGYRASPLVKSAILNGSSVIIARVWRHAHQDTEEKLKKQKKSTQLCPICSCTSV